MATSRKKGDYSVLSEINTEDEWNTLCQRKGLTIVDVYSEWSGPCSAMTNFLKKIKLEVNDDLLQYAMAKSDTIPQLDLFKGHCKPIWLFIASGEPVAVMHGANAPLLQRMIEKEIRKERQVLKGEASREIITFEEAVPVKSRCKAAANLWADTDEEDNADSGDEDTQDTRANEDQSKNFAILLVEAFIYEDSDKLLTLKEFFTQEGFEIIKEQDIVLTLDDIRMFTSGLSLDEDQYDTVLTHLLETTCKAMLVRCNELVKAIPKMNEYIGLLYETPEVAQEAPPPKSEDGEDGDAEKVTEVVVVNKKTLFVDEEVVIEGNLRNYFCDPNDPNKRVGLLCPDYNGFLALMEKHFLAALTHVLEGNLLDNRIVMLVFLEEQQHFVMTELKDSEMDIFGSCTSSLNPEKAKVLTKNKRNKLKADEEEHSLLVELSHSLLLSVVVKRETEKSQRKCQNAIFKELEPLVYTFHLPSIKLFFSNVKTEEVDSSGEFLSHMDQGVSSDEDEGEVEAQGEVGA